MRLRSSLGWVVSVCVAAAAGCYTGPSIGVAESGTRVEASGTEPEAATASADLPCDVAAVLASACSSCHGTMLADGAPNHLLSYDDLAAPVPGNQAVSQAELALARMRDEKKPMPPSSIASPEAIAVLEKWIADGMPKGTCSAGAAVD